MRLNRFRRSIFALIQLAAILFVVAGGAAFALLEGGGEAHSVLFCEGDHEKCGCDPELVAAKACCCYTRGPLAQKAMEQAQENLPPCCAAKKAAQSDEQCTAVAPDRNGGTEGGEPALWIGIPTCGGGTKFFASFAEKLDFSLAQTATLPRPAPCGIVPATETEQWRSLSFEPPVPPPRHA